MLRIQLGDLQQKLARLDIFLLLHQQFGLLKDFEHLAFFNFVGYGLDLCSHFVGRAVAVIGVLGQRVIQDRIERRRIIVQIVAERRMLFVQ